MKKTLITGASRGLGRALAEELAQRKYEVIASARSINDLKDLDVDKKITLDVTDEQLVKKSLQECGNIDVLINNAAYTVGGPVEAIPIEEIRKEYETNVIGPLRLIKTFLPGMRKKGGGIIVNVSSAADRFAPPYGGSYSSAKAALAMISESLHFEVEHFGIKVLLIEAGSIKTDMPIKQKQFSSPEYEPLDEQMKKRFEDYFSEDKRNSPASIAKIIADKIENPSNRLKVTAGEDAKFIIAQRIKMSDEEWEKSFLFQGLEW